MNTVLFPDGSPCLLRPCFPSFRPQPPRRPSPGICFHPPFRLPGPPARGPGRLVPTEGSLPTWVMAGASHSARRLAARRGRIGFTLLRSLTSLHYGPMVHLRQLSTPCCHDAVAFGHRRVNEPPDEDFHLAIWTPSQAHERGIHSPSDTATAPRCGLKSARQTPPQSERGIHSARLRQPQRAAD